MFTKIREFEYGKTKDTELRKLAKVYSYPNDMNVYDIANMISEANCPVDYVDISTDNDYSYGGGSYSFEDFFKYYDGISSVDCVSFIMNKTKSSINVMPKDKEIFLDFDDVTQMPETELSDIIGEKKMKF